MKSHKTDSLCPICLQRIEARRVARGEDYYLEKHCPQHGAFQTVIWQGTPAMADWHRPKIAAQPNRTGHAGKRGCPFDCGLCSNHQQQSCTVVLEVTRRCNMTCPVCFADAGGRGDDPSVETVAAWYRQLREAGVACNIQLSGGEPTLRDDLVELAALGRGMGFDFIQVNTNGLRLAREPDYAAALKAAGVASLFLQFDGVDDDVYRVLRGRALWDQKQAAIDACAAAGLGVVLVPTLVPGQNTRAVGNILRAAMRWHPTVRGVHFQPISYFGRHPGPPDDGQRLTLPALMQLIEGQSGGLFRADHFKPPGCEHSLCSFHARYLLSEDGRPRPLHPLSTNWTEQPAIKAEEGAKRAIDAVARQWSSAPQTETAPGRDETETPASLSSPAPTRGCISPAGGQGGSARMSLDDFLASARSHTFSVSAMAFQDVWNLDLERVQQCCIHTMTTDGRLVPFCLYNLTAVDGRALYRPCI